VLLPGIFDTHGMMTRFLTSGSMRHTHNIYLIGPMGAGKTTIGRLLAKALGVRFVDSDREIEHRTGVCIPMIFEYEGEEGFRRRESEVLAELCCEDGIVLATGGGSILLPKNREVLHGRGFVVYLQCSVEKQLERTHKDSNRPLLKTENPRQRLQELLRVREPIYRSLADFIVDTGTHSSRSAVRQILKAYNRANANS
jgi:shikimate kinase